MGYELGVDLGTTYTAAAAHRDGQVQIVELGNRTATIPSVVFLTEEEDVLTGEAANRRAVTSPDRVAREFKRRIGDPTPLLVGGTPYSAEALSAQLLRWVIRHVAELEGQTPARVAVTHPANWGPYKLDLLHEAFRMADLEDVVTLTEPEAAAIHYSSLERIDAGMRVAVFDLGGGTFDATVLLKTEVGFDFLGQPEGIERLGGIDFDEAVFGFVSRALGGALQELDPSDATSVAAVSRLRRDCVDAKEALSSDTEVSIPVVLPSIQTDVRLTRSEFEQLIRPSLGDSISSMQRAVRGAGLEITDIDLVLLVGGSSRIPLVGQMVGGELGRPVAVDAHPKHSVAMGAARAAAADGGGAHLAEVSGGTPAAMGPSSAEAGATAEMPGPGAEDLPATPEHASPETATSSPQPTEPPVADSGPSSERQVAREAPALRSDDQPRALKLNSNDGGGNNRNRLIGVGAIALVLLIVGAVAVLGAGGGSGDSQGEDVAADDGGITETTVGEEVTATTLALPTTIAPTTTAAAPTTTTTEPPFSCGFEVCAHIENVSVAGGELVFEWSAHGFAPDTSGFHAHFYYNVYDANQVGTNWSLGGAASQGSWQLTDDQRFETAGSAVAVANAPAGTTAICVVPANSAHAVTNPAAAECFELPPELLP